MLFYAVKIFTFGESRVFRENGSRIHFAINAN